MKHEWYTAVMIALIAAVARGQTPPPPTDSTEDGKELGEKLIRRVRTDSEEGMMAEIIRLMDTAAARLEVEFDAGEETQVLQQRIMDQLDEAIQEASSARHPGKQRQQISKGDKRRKHRRTSRQSKDGKRTPGDAKDASSSDAADQDSARESGGPSGGNLRERRRSWGNLPRRARDEVIQGASEQYLERFRAWIERYYQALQESEDSQRR